MICCGCLTNVTNLWQATARSLSTKQARTDLYIYIYICLVVFGFEFVRLSRSNKTTKHNVIIKISKWFVAAVDIMMVTILHLRQCLYAIEIAIAFLTTPINEVYVWNRLTFVLFGYTCAHFMYVWALKKLLVYMLPFAFSANHANFLSFDAFYSLLLFCLLVQKKILSLSLSLSH